LKKRNLTKRRNPNKLFLILSLLVLLYPQSIHTQEVSISEGHHLLQNKQFEEARDIYKQLVEGGYESVSLFYNLGIVEFELGHYPEAILFFEKALRIDPKDKNVLHNLNLANKKIDQDFIAIDDFFLKSWWENWVLSLSVGTWLILSFLALLSLLACFYFYQFGKSYQQKKWGMRAFYPMIFVFILIISSNLSRLSFRNSANKAILLESNSLYMGPDSRSEEMYELIPGTKVEILDSLNGWLKIELINKEFGWMEEKGLGRI